MRPVIVDLASINQDGDLIFIAGSRECPEVSCRLRPMAFLHAMDFINPVESPTRRVQLVQSLSAFGQGYIRHRPLILQGCLFHVAPGNATMEAFARTLGSQSEAGQTYRIDYTKGG